MKESASLYHVSMAARVALSRWGVGYDVFVVGPSGLLVDWCWKGLVADAFCVLGEDKKIVEAVWNGTASSPISKMNPELAEAFIFAVDALATEKGLLPRDGYPPYPCECGRVGEPTVAMTTLGDGLERVGLWCRSCRKALGFTEINDRAIPFLPPGRWLAYDRMLPEIGDKWPERREDATASFEFGANAK